MLFKNEEHRADPSNSEGISRVEEDICLKLRTMYVTLSFMCIECNRCFWFRQRQRLHSKDIEGGRRCLRFYRKHLLTSVFQFALIGVLPIGSTFAFLRVVVIAFFLPSNRATTSPCRRALEAFLPLHCLMWETVVSFARLVWGQL